jgi:hypothetical protein
MDSYCFDFYGVYLGRVDDAGTFFDARGTKWGRVVGSDAVYDFNGNCVGRIDAQGSLFAADGRCRGYIRDWKPPTSPSGTVAGDSSTRGARAAPRAMR